MHPVQHTLPTPYPVGPVHCYSLDINDQLILIDTGPPTEEAKQYLKKNLDLQKLQHVLITHCHIDHYGLAAWLEREYGCTIYLPYRDSLKITNHSRRLDGMVKVLKGVGFTEDFLVAFRADMDSDSVFPDFPLDYKISEEELPEDIGINTMPCPGHSQSDLVYYSDDWAITGDTMLREIFQSPLLDIDLLTGKRFQNYDAYCETILKLATLREKKILPGHRSFIIGVDYNISYYTGKLLERAKRSQKFSRSMEAPEVVEHLFGGSLQEPFLKYLKVSEIVFIRDFIANPDKLKRSLEQIGLYQSLSESFIQAVEF